MEKVDIQIRKGKSEKSGFIEGEFFVKALDFDELMDLQAKASEDSDNNGRLIQACLMDDSGEPVFKPQQINVIKDRMSGVDYMVVLMEANQLNDFSKLNAIAEKYAKNSKSNQNSN